MAAKTKEERVKLIDAKIEKKKAEIAELEATKQKLLRPVVSMKTVMDKAKEKGMSPEEVAAKLNLDI